MQQDKYRLPAQILFTILLYIYMNKPVSIRVVNVADSDDFVLAKLHVSPTKESELVTSTRKK